MDDYSPKSYGSRSSLNAFGCVSGVAVKECRFKGDHAQSESLPCGCEAACFSLASQTVEGADGGLEEDVGKSVAIRAVLGGHIFRIMEGVARGGYGWAGGVLTRGKRAVRGILEPEQ